MPTPSPSPRFWAQTIDPESLNARFFDRLAPHAEAVGWNTQGELARACKKLTGDSFSEATLSDFFQGKRRIGIDHVNRIAAALALAYDALSDSNNPASRGIATLHAILDELLIGAGYSVFGGGRGHNIVWDRLRSAQPAERTLRTGWFPWAPLAMPAGPRSGDRFIGLAHDLQRPIEALLGVECIPKLLSWPRVFEPLLDGEIDMITCVQLRLPMRLLDVSFSKAIPGVRCPVNGVAHADHLKKVRGSAGQSMNDIDLRRITWVVGQSETTMALARLLDPEKTAMVDTKSPINSIEEGCRDVLLRPIDDDGRLRVFPTEQLTAVYARSPKGLKLSKLDTMLDPNKSREIGLGVCFAVHIREPRLLELINACLDEIYRKGSFLPRILEPWLEFLAPANALSSRLTRLRKGDGGVEFFGPANP